MTVHEIAIRAARVSDFEALLAMKSDPEEVRWSGFAGAPDPQQFRRWFDQALVDPDRVMFTGIVDEIIRGYVHFRRLGPTTFGVSTGVVRGFRAMGIGTRLRRQGIEDLRTKFPEAQIEAWLAENNIASQRSWAKMGFQPTEIMRPHQFLCPARTEIMRRWVKSDPV
jgi:RimJ/RimL family protein N-acetyltransferase